MLREHRALERGFQRRLRATYGPGLDAMYEFYAVLEEVGSDLQQAHSERDDDLTEAMLALHACACLLAVEVHRCLSGGFPFAAWARARSLHETRSQRLFSPSMGASPVRAIWRRDSSTTPSSTRRAISTWPYGAVLRSARSSNRRLPTSVIGSLRCTGRRSAETTAGRVHCSRPRSPATASLSPSWRRADTGLDRTDYRHASHHVHASAWTLSLNRLERGGQDYRLTGPTNLGLAEPATVAMTAAVMTLIAVVEGVDDGPPALRSLLAVGTVKPLVLRSAELLAEGEAVVMTREERQ